jgi:predicted membrane protein
MEPVEFCPKCGARAEGGKYCRWCGANLALISQALAKSKTARISDGAVQTTLGLFHTAKISNERRDIGGQTAMAVFGEVKIDLTVGPLPPGESKISIYSVFGSAEIIVPKDVGIRITGLCMIGSVKVRRKDAANGFFDTGEYRSPDYEQAARRLHIDAVTVFGELKVKK